MTLWQDKPETEGKIPNYRIMRTPAGRAISGICISEELVGCKLHFWKGRSKPHTEEACDACIAGHVPRWKGYLELFCPKSKQVNIIELTERVWGELDTFKRQKGTLRGAQITLKRMNNKQNGPLQIRLEEHLFDQTTLPPAQDLREILARIWEVRQTTLPGMVESDEELAKTPELRIG